MNKQARRISPNNIKQLETLHRISGELLMLQSPQITGHDVITVLEDIMLYEYAAILLIDQNQKRLVPYALSKKYSHNQALGVHYGKPSVRAPETRNYKVLENLEFFNRSKEHILSLDIYLGTGVTGWVARHGESICSGDIQNHPHYVAIRDDIRSELCVPLRLEDRIIGVINIETPVPEAYTEDDLMLMEAVSNLVAVAINNIQLHQKIQTHVEELEQRVEERTVHLNELNSKLALEVQRKIEAEEENTKTIHRLNTALSDVKRLENMLPICSSCKKIRDDQGYWKQIDVYFRDHSDLTFSHGICPDCAKLLYPDAVRRIDEKK